MDRPLSNSKMALSEIDKQLSIIREDIKKASLKNNLSLLEKIDVIEDWYALQHIVCNDMDFECRKCPFLESIDRDYDCTAPNGEYYECTNCKFDFGSGYAGDIIPYIEKYRDRIDAYKKVKTMMKSTTALSGEIDFSKVINPRFYGRNEVRIK